MREQFPKRFVVLDDAVVDDGDLSLATEVRVGIHVVGGAVRGPSRVSDADRALGLMLAHVTGEVGHLPLPLFHPEGAIWFKGGDARAVVPAVFQTFEPIDQDGVSRLFAQVANDSAHGPESRALLS